MKNRLQKILDCLNEINLNCGLAMDLADKDKLSWSEEEELEDMISKMDDEIREIKDLI